MSIRQTWDCVREFLLEVANNVAFNWRAYCPNLNGVRAFVVRKGRNFSLVFLAGSQEKQFELGKIQSRRDGGHTVRNYQGLSKRIAREFQRDEVFHPALTAIEGHYQPIPA